MKNNTDKTFDFGSTLMPVGASSAAAASSSPAFFVVPADSSAVPTLATAIQLCKTFLEQAHQNPRDALVITGLQKILNVVNDGKCNHAFGCADEAFSCAFPEDRVEKDSVNDLVIRLLSGIQQKHPHPTHPFGFNLRNAKNLPAQASDLVHLQPAKDVLAQVKRVLEAIPDKAEQLSCKAKELHLGR